MDEKNSVRTYKRWLAIVSILLVAVLCAQGVYWARFHGKTAEGTNTEQAIEQQAAEQLSTVTEKPAESADEAGQNTEGEQSASVQPAEETQQEQSATEPSPTEEQTAAEQSPKEEQPTTDRGTLSRDGYTLEQVVIMSRHNIRSPMSGNGSVLQKVTPHEWFEWSSNPSELSLRGGAAETIIGQYFRKWLEKEGLFPENYHPDEGAVRIYANSKQRTIATAEFFMSGLLPTANMQLEYDVEY